MVLDGTRKPAAMNRHRFQGWPRNAPERDCEQRSDCAAAARQLQIDSAMAAVGLQLDCITTVIGLHSRNPTARARQQVDVLVVQYPRYGWRAMFQKYFLEQQSMELKAKKRLAIDKRTLRP